MSEKNFYERYWSNHKVSNDKGVAELPPEWQDDDLTRILDFSQKYLSGTVLDAGCGDGFLLNQIKSLNNIEKVFGVDISSIATNLAEKNVPEAKFKNSELVDLDYDDNYFDCITMVEVIEHLVDIEGVLEELKRILKPNGYLIITTTDFNWAKKILISAFFFDKYFYPTNPHIRFFTKKTLESVLNEHDFLKVDYRWNGGYFGIMPKGQIMVSRNIKDI